MRKIAGSVMRRLMRVTKRAVFFAEAGLTAVRILSILEAKFSSRRSENSGRGCDERDRVEHDCVDTAELLK